MNSQLNKKLLALFLRQLFRHFTFSSPFHNATGFVFSNFVLHFPVFVSDSLFQSFTPLDFYDQTPFLAFPFTFLIRIFRSFVLYSGLCFVRMAFQNGDPVSLY